MIRRKYEFVYREVQLRVILATLSVAFLVLLVNFHLVMYSLWKLANNVATNAQAAEFFESQRPAILSNLILSLSLTLPLAALLGIHYSFRFAGPLQGLRIYFAGLKTGRWDQPCQFRKGDDLQDLSRTINVGMGSVREFLEQNRDAIAQARSTIDALRPSERGGVAEKAAQVSQRLGNLLSVYAERMPGTKANPAQPGLAAPAAASSEAEPELVAARQDD